MVDVHGAGAQRSDPKTGDPQLFPHGRSPQGDTIRICNHVRLVRGGGTTPHIPAQPAAATMPPAARPAGAPTAGQAGPPNSGASRQPGMPMASPIITALDTNQNGTIEAEELTKAAEVLKSLDKNKDGNLTADEYRPQLQGGPGGKCFGAFARASRAGMVMRDEDDHG